MKKTTFFIFLILYTVTGFSQGLIKGVVTDAQTRETLIGANIVYESGKGTVTDLDGTYSLELPRGTYTFKISYVGYQTVQKNVIVEDGIIVLDVSMQSTVIDEVIVTADMAIARETPVAFTNISPSVLEEELAGQDIPLILNTTPGVYATQQGGGDGDARITIRGFDQTNISVMLDGIPVNDMENGWVYWSNWFGLDAVTRTMQVQRGLGASQLAIPSVGGTINILTKGIDNEARTSIKQELDGQGKIRSSIGYTSGKLKNGWGLTMAGSYKRGEGWVDKTFSEGWFYYAKVDKRFKNHLITASALGAPQSHEQRSYKRPISAYDTVYAKKVGIDIQQLKRDANYSIFNKGITYNQHWGTFKRDANNENAPSESLSEKVNTYHKPQFTLRDFWSISDRMTLSTNAYLSIGKGGGISPQSSIKDTQLDQDPNSSNYGQINWQRIYDSNTKPSPPFYIQPTSASNYLVTAKNEHYWYGLLSKLNYSIDNNLDFSGGIDIRSYKGIHYKEVNDLLGAEYAIDKNDTRIDYNNNPEARIKKIGDKVDFYNEGHVRYGGAFGQIEYKSAKYTAFVNLSTAYSNYKKVDYFEDKESDWAPGFGGTIKGGFNYNWTDQSNVFINLGYLSKVKPFKYYYQGYTVDLIPNVKNELIKAIELGYSFATPTFSVNLNAYYTLWENKPTSNVNSIYNLQPGDDDYIEGDPDNNNEKRIYAIISGMDARHTGIELDFAYNLLHNLEFQGTLSLGDWIWDSQVKGLQYYLSDNNKPIQKTIDFDARGVHVGDAAQNQLGFSVRYEPIKKLYFKIQETYFDKYYSNFTPEATTDANGNVVDSWKIPNFALTDVHAGYGFKLRKKDKARFDIKISVLNALNTTYIWDATNNDSYSPYSSYQDFDAKSATVFFGMGRRFTTSLRVTF